MKITKINELINGCKEKSQSVKYHDEEIGIIHRYFARIAKYMDECEFTKLHEISKIYKKFFDALKSEWIFIDVSSDYVKYDPEDEFTYDKVKSWKDADRFRLEFRIYTNNVNNFKTYGQFIETEVNDILVFCSPNEDAVWEDCESFDIMEVSCHDNNSADYRYCQGFVFEYVK